MPGLGKTLGVQSNGVQIQVVEAGLWLHRTNSRRAFGAVDHLVRGSCRDRGDCFVERRNHWARHGA